MVDHCNIERNNLYGISTKVRISAEGKRLEIILLILERDNILHIIDQIKVSRAIYVNRALPSLHGVSIK